MKPGSMRSSIAARSVNSIFVQDELLLQEEVVTGTYPWVGETRTDNLAQLHYDENWIR